MPKILPISEPINSMFVWALKAQTHFLSFLFSTSLFCRPHTRPSIQRTSSYSHTGPLRCLCIHRAAWDWSVRLKEPVSLAASSSMLTRLYRASFDSRSPLCSETRESLREKLWWIEFLVLVKALMYSWFKKKENVKITPESGVALLLLTRFLKQCRK